MWNQLHWFLAGQSLVWSSSLTPAFLVEVPVALRTWEIMCAMFTLATDLHLCLFWMEMESMSLCPSQPADLSLVLTVRIYWKSRNPVVSFLYSAEGFYLTSIWHHTDLYLWELKLSIHWPILTKAFFTCNAVTVTSGKWSFSRTCARSDKPFSYSRVQREPCVFLKCDRRPAVNEAVLQN